jgi:CubicO group peptidase (beta-lactamase class C family)
LPLVAALSLARLAAAEPEPAPGKPLGIDPEVARATGDLLQKLCGADEFSGVVLLAKDGRPFFEHACGMASREFAAPNRSDTKFNVGSITKVFTRVAIAQLAEKGKLSLTDTIRRHLPDYTGPGAERITIQQLLTMTSGLGDIFGDAYSGASKERFRTLADYLPLFQTKPLQFEPGAGRRYSNAGYVVLGLIVERVTGQDYHTYVRERVFSPAGMKESDWFELDAAVPNLADGYTSRGPEGPTPGPRRRNVFSLPARGSSAGGSYSPARDLLAFDAALRSGALLTPPWNRWILGGPPPDGRKVEAERALKGAAGGLGVAGGAPGVNAVLEIDFERAYTIVVLSNVDPPSAEQVARSIRGWLGMAAD